MPVSAQVDFVQVPPLPVLPTTELLQWSVAGTGNYGTTYDKTAGTVGVRGPLVPRP